MRVFVTGGTGAVGRYAVSALIDAGHTVSALARSEQSAEALRHNGAAAIRVSLFDRDALTTAFADHEAVVNLASALPTAAKAIRLSAWADCERVRTEGSAAVVDAALAAAVPRLVQESVVMIYADGGARWINEDQPVEHYPISRGNHAAEASARRFASAGGTSNVLRFGLFYGTGAAHSEEILTLARRHIGFSPGRPGAYLSSIHVSDAGRAVVAALDAPGGVYNVVDDEPVTKSGYARACADAVGTQLWIRAPGRLGLLLGDRMTSLTRSLRVSNSAFRAATGWAPQYPCVRDGYAAMARDAT